MAAGLDLRWDAYKESPFDVCFTLDVLMGGSFSGGRYGSGYRGPVSMIRFGIWVNYADGGFVFVQQSVGGEGPDGGLEACRGSPGSKAWNRGLQPSVIQAPCAYLCDVRNDAEEGPDMLIRFLEERGLMC